MSTTQWFSVTPFGATAVADNTTRFTYCGNDVSLQTTSGAAEIPIADAGNFKNLYVNVTANDINSATSATVTLMITGSASTLTVSYSNNETGVKQDTTHTPSAANTDNVSYRIVATSVSGNHSVTVQKIGMEFTSSTSGNSTLTLGGKGVTTTESNVTVWSGPSFNVWSSAAGADVNSKGPVWGAGTLTRLRINITANAKGVSTNWAIAVNGTTSALNITVNAGVTGAQEDSSVVSVSASDFINGQLIVNGVDTSSIANSVFAVTYIGTDGVYPQGGQDSIGLVSGALAFCGLGSFANNATEGNTTVVPAVTQYVSGIRAYASSNTRSLDITISNRDNGANGLAVTYATGESGEKINTSGYDTITGGSDTWNVFGSGNSGGTGTLIWNSVSLRITDTEPTTNAPIGDGFAPFGNLESFKPSQLSRETAFQPSQATFEGDKYSPPRPYLERFSPSQLARETAYAFTTPPTAVSGDRYRPRANLESFKPTQLARVTAFPPSEPQQGAGSPRNIVVVRHYRHWLNLWVSMFGGFVPIPPTTAIPGSDYKPRSSLDSFKAWALWREIAFAPGNFTLYGDNYKPRADIGDFKAKPLWRETAFAPGNWILWGDNYKPRADLGDFKGKPLWRETAFAPGNWIIYGDNYKPRADLSDFRAKPLWRGGEFPPSDHIIWGDYYQARASLELWRAFVLARSDSAPPQQPTFVTWGDPFKARSSLDDFRARPLWRDLSFPPGNWIPWGDNYKPRADLNEFHGKPLWRETAFSPSQFSQFGDTFKPRSNIGDYRARPLWRETAFPPSQFSTWGDWFQAHASLEMWRAFQLARSDSRGFPTALSGDTYRPRANLDSWRARVFYSNEQPGQPTVTAISGERFMPLFHSPRDFNTPALQWFYHFASGASGPPTPTVGVTRPMRTIRWFRNQ